MPHHIYDDITVWSPLWPVGVAGLVCGHWGAGVASFHQWHRQHLGPVCQHSIKALRAQLCGDFDLGSCTKQHCMHEFYTCGTDYTDLKIVLNHILDHPNRYLRFRYLF